MTTQTRDNACHCKIEGSFTFTDHERFRQLIDRVRAEKPESLELDLSAVEFVDSAALGMLLLAQEQLAHQTPKIVLRGAQGQVRKMLNISNFCHIFTIE